jgi:lincosamide nucleotidyltransferase A/C/D/E
MAFTADDVHAVLDALASAGVDARVVGGWGVDALLGGSSREHADLDLLVPEEHDAMLRAALGARGFAEVRGVAINYVVRDARGREVDVHLVRSGADGDALYTSEDGSDWVFPATSFTTGRIADRDVTCVDADEQMREHAFGYEPGETDFADMLLLHHRFGTRLLPPYDQPLATS